MSGIQGLTKNTGRPKRLPVIGKLRKGAARTEQNIERKQPGKDLEWFRFTSNEPGLVELFTELFGADPAIITAVLPLATPAECFPNRCEARDKAGFLEHACDGKTCEIWRDSNGVYHEARPESPGPPCPGGCKAVGRLYLEFPEFARAGYSGWIVAETHARNDIPVIWDALQVIAEKRNGTMLGLRGVPVILRRTPVAVATPRPDGRRVRQEKWLVQLLESPEWAARQAEAARDDALESPHRALPAADWEEANHPGRPVSEVMVAEDEWLHDADAEDKPESEPTPEPVPPVKQPQQPPAEQPNGKPARKGQGHRWPSAILNWAMDPNNCRGYYKALNHVVNALETSGLSPDTGMAELQDWLSSHAKERMEAGE